MHLHEMETISEQGKTELEIAYNGKLNTAWFIKGNQQMKS